MAGIQERRQDGKHSGKIENKKYQILDAENVQFAHFPVPKYIKQMINNNIL